MRLVRGGDFDMGSQAFYPEEAPVRRVAVDDFWIDEAPVTNAEFAAFVQETGYATFAETAPDVGVYPGMAPEMAHPGSAVFTPEPPSTDMPAAPWWWRFVIGADWRHPQGPQSDLRGKEDHPVVHVVAQDAEAYAAWAGKALPTEAQWEYAARGGLVGGEYAWEGDDLAPGGRRMAHTWSGAFPHENDAPPGLERTAPVRSYPANGFGLFDMIGNVWEWTADWYAEGAAPEAASCCALARERLARARSCDPASPAAIPRRVLKGGSHLCSPDYCRRYRPAARMAQAIDSSASHVGFRLVTQRP